MASYASYHEVYSTQKRGIFLHLHKGISPELGNASKEEDLKKEHVGNNIPCFTLAISQFCQPLIWLD